jgi:uncharacterized protein YkwD
MGIKMKINVRWFFLILIWGLSLSSRAEVVHSHPSSSDEAMAQEILLYVNEYRVTRGLPKLVMSQAASREARQHSLEMSRHQVPFGHAGFGQRMRHLYREIENTEGGAENVAYNYKNARIVVDGWIKSPGHHRNIVGRYDTTGIGIARDSQGRLYFTQLFVRTNEHRHTHVGAGHHPSKRVHFFIG